MKRLIAALASIAALVLAVAPAASAGLQLTPVQRLPFPERAYVVDLGRDADLGRGSVRAWENGSPVGRFSLRPLAASSIHSGVVLAVDASDSMAGRPYQNALAGARAFIDARTGAERIGVVAFNSGVQVVQPLTASPDELHDALDHAPALARGTHIYDGVTEALALLRRSGVSTGAIVLLSDGADLGSTDTLDDVVTAARLAHVRIFTVGLVTKTYDAAPLQALATETGGSYYEALSAVELTPIYTSLGRRLASQYLLGYRSKAIPGSAVTLRLSVRGIGSAAADYTAPTREGLAPFHRPFLKRFLLSPAAPVVLSLLAAAVVAGLLALLLTRARSGAVGRIEEFLRSVRAPAEQLKTRGRDVGAALGSSPRAQGWMAKLERDLEIAAIQTPSRRLVLRTATATVLASIVLALISPVLFLAGLLTPLAVRGWLKRKVRAVRNDRGFKRAGCGDISWRDPHSSKCCR